MVKIPAALFEPDKSRYNMASSDNIMNALPVADGWTSFPGPSPQHDALSFLSTEDGSPLTGPSEEEVFVTTETGLTGYVQLPEDPRGGVFIRLQDGSTRLFVGSATKLYEYDRGNNSFNDVSGPSAPYNCDGRWYFALYGSTIYCGNGADPEQMLEIGTDLVFSDNSSAPIATDAVPVADFMMRALTDNSVQWSALDDPQSNTVGIRFCDIQPFGDGNGVQRILPMSSGALVIQRDKFEMLNYPDSEYVFRRSQMNGYRGSNAKWSACVIGQDDFVVYCQDGFFRGPNMQPIGAERVDRYILDVCSETDRQNMTASADFRRKVVLFRVQKSDGSYLSLGYHWQLDRWFPVNPDLREIFKLETVGLTIGQLEQYYPTLGDMDQFTLGSSIFDGGALDLGGIDANGFLVILNGPSLEATVESNEAVFNGTDRTFVNGGRADTDAANFTAYLATADYKGQAFNQRNGVTPSARTRFVPFRGDGRVHKVTTIIPEGEPWTIWNGVDLDVAGAGKS